MELLDRLSRSGHLPHDVAQDAAATLFAQGYRMAHPILLSHAPPPIPPTSEPTSHPPFSKDR